MSNEHLQLIGACFAWILFIIVIFILLKHAGAPSNKIKVNNDSVDMFKLRRFVDVSRVCHNHSRELGIGKMAIIDPKQCNRCKEVK